MKKYVCGFFIVALGLSMDAYANTDGFYIEGLFGSPIQKLDASTDYAGASGYVCATCPTGRMGDVHTNSRATYGAKVGYQYSRNVRVDLSYYDLSYGLTKWGTDYISFNGTYNPATATPFTGKLSSQAFILGVYYSRPLSSGFSPYIGAGAGFSRNEFAAADEGGYNTIAANTKTSFAYKMDVGVGYEVSKNVALDLGVSLMSIGDFSSGTHRLNNEPITPYKFNSGINTIATLGLIYKL